jgi:hypothetical protein
MGGQASYIAQASTLLFVLPLKACQIRALFEALELQISRS